MPDPPAERNSEISTDMARQAAVAEALRRHSAAVAELARQVSWLQATDASSIQLTQQAVGLQSLAAQIAELSHEFKYPPNAGTVAEVLNMHAAAIQRLADQAARLSVQLELRGPRWRAENSLRDYISAAQTLAIQARSLSDRTPDPAELEARQGRIIYDIQRLTEAIAEVERVARANEAAQRQRDADVASDSIVVSIYLADAAVHERVQTAVEQWLDTADVSIESRGDPVIGSWFRMMTATLRRPIKTPAGQEALLTAVHVADSHLVQAQDAYVTATLLQNVGPVLQALQPTRDAVVRVGALLIVKIDWVVQIHQLTAAQQAILDHQPHLASSPKDIITALQPQGSIHNDDAVSSETLPLSDGRTSTN